MGLEDGIWALRLGFGPQDWDLGLKARIWASRLRYGPGGWGAGTKKEEEEKEEEEEHHSGPSGQKMRAKKIELKLSPNPSGDSSFNQI